MDEGVTSDPELTEKIAENSNLTVYYISRIFYLIANSIAIKAGEDGELEGQKIARICKFFNKSQNRLIAALLIKHRATTSLELQRVLKLKDYTVTRAMKTLEDLDIVIAKTRVKTPYRDSDKKGAGIKVWSLTNAQPKDRDKAQKRYREIIQATEDPSPVRQCQMPEAIALCKTYMDPRGLTTVPDRVILDPMLKDQGINVDHNQLLTALVKEGYSP